jgi:5-hydroxyisourate hydrolase
MTHVSTHVLDTSLGKAAADMAVRLERHESSGQWEMVAAARTDQDGRCAQLIPESSRLPPGIYRLTFDTAGYHLSLGISGLYPIVQITFSVRDGETHFHIPLLLSPHGYTTYRGS